MMGMAQDPDISKLVTLDDVTVVSTPKEKGAMRLQPTAVSLLSSRQLDAAHVTSLKGITSMVPNLFMPDYGSRLTSAIYIRGIGSRINTPAVGLYVDNIPYADKSAFDFNFYDIERVDVLRGPQGTLYGRNAMGGTIRVYTRNPFHYQGSDMRLGYRSGDNHRTFSLTHYHRPSDQFAFSAGGYYEGADGFFKNRTTGKRVDKMQSGGGRLRGIYLPFDRLTLDLSVSYDYSDEGAYPYYYLGSLTSPEPYPTLVGQISNNRESQYRRNLLNAGLNAEYKADRWVLNAITGYQNISDRMFMDQDFLAADFYSLEQRQRINTLTEEIVVKSRNEEQRGNAFLRRWQWVGGINAMYQWLHAKAPVSFYDDGLTMLENNINRNMPDVSKINMLSMMGFTSMGVDLPQPFSTGGVFDTPTLNAALFHQSTFSLTDRLSLTAGLRLNYERLKIDYNAPSSLPYAFIMANPREALHVDLQGMNADASYIGSMKHDYWRVLPKISVKYDFNERSNIYVTVAEGMRSGGYNVQMFSDLLQGGIRQSMMSGVKDGVIDYLKTLSQTNPNMPAYVVELVTGIMNENMPTFDAPAAEQIVYKPEYSWNYEIGTHLTTADRRLMTDAALFFLDTRDQQIARFVSSGMGRAMVNAGHSQSYGAELTMTYLPVQALRLSLNYGYTHATFKDYEDGTAATNGTAADYSGKYVPFIPQHTLGLDAAYTWQLNSTWARALTLGANYNGAGRIYWTESNHVGTGIDAEGNPTPKACQDFYSLLGARLQLVLDHCSIQLWGRNLTDADYQTFYFESAGRGYEQRGKPFQLGVDVKLHF